MVYERIGYIEFIIEECSEDSIKVSLDDCQVVLQDLDKDVPFLFLKMREKELVKVVMVVEYVSLGNLVKARFFHLDHSFTLSI